MSPERLTLLICVELSYVASARAILPLYFDGIALEIWITAFRVLTAWLYWILYRPLILSRSTTGTNAAPLGALVCGVLTLLSALLIADYNLPDTGTRYVFAVTSLAVALREELLYRGVLLNFFAQRLGIFAAILTSNIIFVIYHWGAITFDVPTVVEVFLVGCTYSAIYVITGSIWLVIGFHAFYDAIYALSPLPEPFAEPVGNSIQLVAFLGALYLLARKKRQQMG